MSGLDELRAIVARLRSPNGCPWDQRQTPETVREYVLEEAYEVVQAIDEGSDASVRAELGDLLFNIVLLARMAEERGAFTLTDVITSISDKMVRRHPHVFADSPATSADEVAASWQQLKALEHPERESVLDGVPAALPALTRADRLATKAAQLGFDWADHTGPRAKVAEELHELDEAIASGDAGHIEHELGDVLLSVTNLARHLPIAGAEPALRRANLRFEKRFRRVESLAAASETPLDEHDLATLEAWWQQAKEEQS